MDRRTTGIIATIATVLLCACPGFGLCLFGGITAAGQGTFNDQSLSPTVGFVLLCVSLIFIAIPVVVGIVTLRRKPGDVAPVVTAVSEPMPPVPPKDDEPLPPAS